MSMRACVCVLCVDRSNLTGVQDSLHARLGKMSLHGRGKGRVQIIVVFCAAGAGWRCFRAVQTINRLILVSHLPLHLETSDHFVEVYQSLRLELQPYVTIRAGRGKVGQSQGCEHLEEPYPSYKTNEAIYKSDYCLCYPLEYKYQHSPH